MWISPRSWSPFVARDGSLAPKAQPSESGPGKSSARQGAAALVQAHAVHLGQSAGCPLPHQQPPALRPEPRAMRSGAGAAARPLPGARRGRASSGGGGSLRPPRSWRRPGECRLGPRRHLAGGAGPAGAGPRATGVAYPRPDLARTRPRRSLQPGPRPAARGLPADLGRPRPGQGRSAGPGWGRPGQRRAGARGRGTRPEGLGDLERAWDWGRVGESGCGSSQRPGGGSPAPGVCVSGV